MLEYWHPTLHKRCFEHQRDWVRDVLLILTRRLHPLHVVVVVVVTLIKRAELGRELHYKHPWGQLGLTPWRAARKSGALRG